MKTAYWTHAFNFISFQNLNFVFYFKDIKLKKPESGRSDSNRFLNSRKRINSENDLTDSRKSKGKPRTILKSLRNWQPQAPPEVGSRRSGSKKRKIVWRLIEKQLDLQIPVPCALLGDCPSPTMVALYRFIPWEGFLDWEVYRQRKSEISLLKIGVLSE